MNPTINYLASSFIGVVFGCIISLYIYRNGQYKTAKFDLIEHVRIMIHSIRFMKQGNNPVFTTFQDNIVSIQVKFMKLHNATISRCKRTSLSKAWCDLVGHDKNKCTRPGIENMKFPEKEEDAVNRLSDFLKAVEKI